MATRLTKMHNKISYKIICVLLSCVLCFTSVCLLASLEIYNSMGYSFSRSSENTLLGNGSTKYAEQIKTDIDWATYLVTKYQTLDETKIEESAYYQNRIQKMAQEKQSTLEQSILNAKKEIIDNNVVDNTTQDESYYVFDNTEGFNVGADSLIHVTLAEQEAADKNNNGLITINGVDYYKGISLNVITVDEQALEEEAEQSYQESFKSFKDGYYSNFRSMKNALYGSSSFRFCIVDRTTGTIYTNMDVSGVEEAASQGNSGFAMLTKDSDLTLSQELSSVLAQTYEYYQNRALYDSSTTYAMYTDSPYASLLYSDFAGELDPNAYDSYFQVPLNFDSPNTQSQDIYSVLAAEYLKAKQAFLGVLIAFGILGILWLASMVLLLVSAGKVDENGAVVPAGIDRFPISVHAVLIALALFGLGSAGMASAGTLVSNYDNYTSSTRILWTALCGILAVGMNLCLIEWGTSLVRQIRTGLFVKSSLTYQIFAKNGKIRVFWNERFPIQDKKLKRRMLLLLVGYAFLMLLLGVYHNLFCFVAMILLSVGFVLYFIRFCHDLQKINSALADAEKGQYDFQLKPEKMAKYIRPIGQKVNNLTDGMKLAVEDAVKNERQKTELITGVSHDLKTPLTSIIAYTDLLKKCDIQDPQAVQYLAVLEEKSAALKKLIEDLIEASKVSSGNVEIHLGKINLSELLEQVYGEYELALQDKGLLLKLNLPEEPLFVTADGQKVYRVLENLFSNIQKYALENTRVYIDLKKEDQMAMVALKNVSREEMNYDPSELTERFFRGDRSRTTEGSGLGLSIAESLTTAQGGTFTISIDGDLFKVMIRLPLAE